MTKVMTVILALELMDDMKKTTVITQSDIDTVWETGASSANFEVGETVTYEDYYMALFYQVGRMQLEL